MKTTFTDAIIWIIIVVGLSSAIYGMIVFTTYLRESGLEALSGSIILLCVIVWAIIKLYKGRQV